MTIINPTFLNAYNEGAQDLFTINEFIPATEDNRGVTQYISVGNQATLTYSEFPVNNDDDGSFDNTTGIAYLDGGAGQTFQITAQATFNGRIPVRIKLINTDDNTQVGNSVPADGTMLQISVTPAGPTHYAIVAFTVDGSDFVYPAQIDNAQITIQVVGGYSNGA
jgi:hypothetical protein